MNETLLTDEIAKARAAGFAIDASILDEQEMLEVVREDVKLNRIEYVFPQGLNQIDMFEECRALTKLDDFEAMYDVTMQMLHGKPVIILIKNDDGSKTELASFMITDRYMNLRGVEALDRFPCLVTWLTGFIGAYISKKFPIPGRIQPQQQESKKQSGRKNKRGTAVAASS